MSLIESNVDPITTLTPLQETIYYFLKKSKQPYDKHQLMVELNLSHKSSFTRSLNQLTSLNLIHWDESNHQVTITRDQSNETPSKDKRSVEALTKPVLTQLRLLPLSKEEETPQPLISSQSIEIVPSIESTSSEKPLTMNPDNQLEIALSNKEKAPLTTSVDPLPSSTKPEKSKESIPEISLPILTQTKEKEKTNNVPTQSSVKPSNQKSPTQKETVKTVTIHPLEAKFQGLNKNTKKLMRSLFKACLSHESWFLTNYQSHLTKEQRESNQLKTRLKMLEASGFIKISGSKSCRLTFQQSPLELCQHVTSFHTFLSENKKAVQLIHERYLNELEPKPVLSEPVPAKETVPTKVLPQAPKALTPVVPIVDTSFKKRYYLLDSENCNQFLSSSQFLKKLKPEDQFIIFLSQNSPSTNPAVLHFLLTHASQIETRFVTVRGKGESDLDHVLTMELAFLWMQDPEAQYVILSKDQGFLAAVNYWTQRHSLKNNQLCLKSEL